ncbi:helix-turn-helix domain-containing protein [Flavobacterium hungaricum]|uniref:AraC family transcriptional regulator n=1 Tax=Flavobacterium hungaricum TaxID=2082725 RepID=A0ABR9TG94_9FLAO|nr:helix-turn-helix domain-containing protein [Flavobacterium hungaricum]MBE8724382.1 AraC family transcriptional regulator [Flavobacterium hungaricum]
MVYENNTLEFLKVTELTKSSKSAAFDISSTDMTFVWNRGSSTSIVVNQIGYKLSKNDIIILTNHHKIEDTSFESARLIKFNLPFINHMGTEVENSLKGALFFNVTSVPIVSIEENELLAFENSWDIFCIEMKSKDNLQYEMLQSILKQIIILCARKLNKENKTISGGREADILRDFRFLVENYFAKHHDVAFYASKLNKSPKTLSNIFSSLSDRTPIDIIHERIMVHARKQIFHTTKSIKEIAYDLGYEDIQTFSRFFKNKEGLSPIQYRERSRFASNQL